LRDEFGIEEVQCRIPNAEAEARSHVTQIHHTSNYFPFSPSFLFFSLHPLARRIAIEADTSKASRTLSHLSHALGKVPGQPTPLALRESELGLAETRRHRSSFTAAYTLPHLLPIVFQLGRLPWILHTNPAMSLLRVSPAGLRLHSCWRLHCELAWLAGAP